MDKSNINCGYTDLQNYRLWFDGDITVTEQQLIDYLLSGFTIDGFCVENISEEIVKYNRLVDDDQKIKIKSELKVLDYSWIIPDQYKQLDVRHYVVSLLEKELINFSGNKLEQKRRIARVQQELSIFEEKNIFDVVKCIIFVINTFNQKNIVWGVGRGSSVASYVLFLIGVHDIDSVLYDLDINEFVKC